MGSSVERIECCVQSRGLSTGEVARRGAAAERGPRRARRGGTSVAFRDRSKQVPSTGRTAMKPIQLALGLSLLVAASGAAQSRGLREVRSWGFGGGGVMVGIPVGEFRNFVDVAGGLGGVIAVNLDRRGSAGLRLTGSYLQYGHERRPVALDLGAVHVRNGPVTYLREGSIPRAADGSLVLRPVRSEANLAVAQLGVVIGLR